MTVATDDAPKFEIYRDKNSQFRYRLVAGNGEIIAVSEAYVSKQGAHNGIKAVMKHAPVARVIDASQTH